MELMEAGIDLRSSAVSLPVSLPEGVEGLTMPDQRPHLVDSSNGHIDVLLLTLPQIGPNHREQYEGIIRALGPDSTTYVFLHGEEHRELLDCLQGLGKVPDKRWKTISTPFELTQWAQDPYSAFHVPHGESLILGEGVQYHSSGMVVADEVSAGLAELGGPFLGHFQSYLFFEGGNILATPSMVLIGKDDLSWNLHRPGLPNEATVSDRFHLLFGAGRKEVLSVGTSEPIPTQQHWGEDLTSNFQPIFHIDMHLTPTGKVGTSGKEILVYGSPSEAARWADLPDDFHLGDAFDEVKRLLEQHFELVNLPLLPVVGTGGVGWRDKAYYLTWNNVLIESYRNSDGETDRYVFIPFYGDNKSCFLTDEERDLRRSLDARVREIWEGQKLGFKVVPLPSMEDLAYLGGSVHCISKTLRRSAAPQNREG